MAFHSKYITRVVVLLKHVLICFVFEVIYLCHNERDNHWWNSPSKSSLALTSSFSLANTLSLSSSTDLRSAFSCTQRQPELVGIFRKMQKKICLLSCWAKVFKRPKLSNFTRWYNATRWQIPLQHKLVFELSVDGLVYPHHCLFHFSLLLLLQHWMCPPPDPSPKL